MRRIRQSMAKCAQRQVQRALRVVFPIDGGSDGRGGKQSRQNKKFWEHGVLTYCNVHVGFPQSRPWRCQAAVRALVHR